MGIITLITGLLPFGVWLLLDDFSAGMVWINNCTLIVGCLFAVVVLAFAISFVGSKSTDSQAKKEDKQQTDIPAVSYGS